MNKKILNLFILLFLFLSFNGCYINNKNNEKAEVQVKKMSDSIGTVSIDYENLDFKYKDSNGNFYAIAYFNKGLAKLTWENREAVGDKFTTKNYQESLNINSNIIINLYENGYKLVD